MPERPFVPQSSISSTSSSSNDSNVNPFDNPRASYSQHSTTSLPDRPPRAVINTAPATHGMEESPERRSDSRIGGEDFIHDEKQWTRQYSASERARRSIHDAEKQAYNSPRNSRPFVYSTDALSVIRSRESLDQLDTMQAQKAVSILLHLSGPCVLLSFLTFIWAIMSLLVTIIYQPLRLCTPKLAFRHQICHFLAPTLNLHLRCIYVDSYPRPSEDNDVYSATWLLIVHLLAPIVSTGNMLAAWVVALYWCLARVVGDPSGVDKKDDGVEAVLGLTHFWQALLLKSIRREHA